MTSRTSKGISLAIVLDREPDKSDSGWLLSKTVMSYLKLKKIASVFEQCQRDEAHTSFLYKGVPFKWPGASRWSWRHGFDPTDVSGVLFPVATFFSFQTRKPTLDIVYIVVCEFFFGWKWDPGAVHVCLPSSVSNGCRSQIDRWTDQSPILLPKRNVIGFPTSTSRRLMPSLSGKNTPTEGNNLRVSRKHVAQGYSHGPEYSVRLGVYRQTIRLAMEWIHSIELLILWSDDFDLWDRWHDITFVSST